MGFMRGTLASEPIQAEDGMQIAQVLIMRPFIKEAWRAQSFGQNEPLVVGIVMLLVEYCRASGITNTHGPITNMAMASYA